jgi:hypothetical protein
MIYKLLKDFNYTTSDKRIMELKKGTTIDRKEGDVYVIKQGRQQEFTIDCALVENNPDYFEKIDLTQRIIALLKRTKSKTAPKISKDIATFLEEDYFKGKELVEEEYLATALEACKEQFIATKEEKWLVPITKLGWGVDESGVFKK